MSIQTETNESTALEGFIDFVETYIDDKGLKADNKSCRPRRTLGKEYGELHGSSVFEAGYTGPFSSNNCLVQSLLFALSERFRLLGEKDRNDVGTYIRHVGLAKWIDPESLFSKVKDTDLYGDHFLPDIIGELLGKVLSINVLWISKCVGAKPFATFSDFEKNQTICIVGNGKHFQPVKFTKFNDATEPTFISRTFDGEAYVNSLQERDLVSIVSDFHMNDLVIFEGELHLVQSLDYQEKGTIVDGNNKIRKRRRNDPTFMECHKLKICRIDNGVEIWVSVHDVVKDFE